MANSSQQQSNEASQDKKAKTKSGLASKPPKPKKQKPDITVEGLSTPLGDSKHEKKFDPTQFIPEEWLKAKGSSTYDKLEVFALKIMYILPVCVTFGLFIVLSSFYIFVSGLYRSNSLQCFLIPTLNGDFTPLGITDYWANSSERDADK